MLKSTDIHPIILEQTKAIGGISQTVLYKGNRIDIGGHRFFSKSRRVNDFWNSIMPLQGAPAIDDKLINRNTEFSENGADPEKQERVMLTRKRISRIFYLRKFFDYPISLKWKTFSNMGVKNTLKSGLGYLGTLFTKKKEENLENFYINRFGKPLYSMFFEDYTQKVWGIHPSKLSADWGSQRVKGLSIFTLFKNIFYNKLHFKNKNIETSLIESFYYPKYGPGQLWEAVASDIKKMGGKINTQARVSKIHITDNHVDYIETADNKRYQCTHLLSSMPIKELINTLSGIEIPKDVYEIANNLQYRDFITVGLLVKKMKIHNQTTIPDFKQRIPDTWIYIQERDVKIGRIQIFNNWSPYMLKDYVNTQWIGLEYFCTEGDKLWNMSEEQFVNMAIDELVNIGFIDANDVLDSTQIKIKKAYPIYIGSYYQLDKVKTFLNSISNLYCIGRNGQHRYNNMDHSMLTAMETVDAIRNQNSDKSAIWAVNTEEDYHESN